MRLPKTEYRLPSLIFALSAVLYFLIAYYIERYDHLPLLSAYCILFAGYFIIYRSSRKHGQLIIFFLVWAIIFRFIFLAAIPKLSDDIFRFIWDGRLWMHGINPFHIIPTEFINNSDTLPEGIDQELYSRLNSPDYYTIYPPVGQYIFLLTAWLFNDSIFQSILLVRIFILAFEAGTLLLLYHQVKKDKLQVSQFVLYAFNPLVIIELSGNLHLEAGFVFFMLIMLYYMAASRTLPAAIAYGLSICSKLVPLIFAPLILKKIGPGRSIIFLGITGVVVLGLFLPLVDRELINAMINSIGLYFQKFEFNASLYYIIREFGYFFKGYNIIQTAGKMLAVAMIIIIVLYAYYEPRKSKTTLGMMWILFVYLLLSTTVHPWYVIPLLALSIFTTYRFPVLWSFLIFFTYLGYTESGYNENLWIMTVEYGLVFGMAVYEICRSAGLFEFYDKIRPASR